MLKRFAIALWLGLLGGAALAQQQQAAPVQQIPSRLDAATGVASVVGAVNAQVTATINVPSGYAYITAIAVDACQDATGVLAANVTFTSTNIAGTPTWPYASPLSIEACYRSFENYPTPLKSAAPGTNVTVVSPSALLHTGFGIRLYYYIAP